MVIIHRDIHIDVNDYHQLLYKLQPLWHMVRDLLLQLVWQQASCITSDGAAYTAEMNCVPIPASRSWEPCK